MTHKEDALIRLIEEMLQDLRDDGLDGKAIVFGHRFHEIIRNMDTVKTIEEMREDLGHGGL